MSQLIVIERRGPIEIITLNRPEVRNALNSSMRAELGDALLRFNGDAAARAAILTGAGDKAFCAGQDLAEARDLTSDSAREWVAGLRQLYTHFRNLDKPLVAALNGVAAGAGIQLALLSDIRVGHAGTRMGQPEINAGLASVIGVHLLEETLGHSRTVELALTGRLVAAEECLALGLLHHVAPDGALMDKAIEVAESLAAKPPNAMRLTKKRFREMTGAGFEETMAAAARLQAEAYATGEPQRIMAEFAEKRGRKG